MVKRKRQRDWRKREREPALVSISGLFISAPQSSFLPPPQWQIHTECGWDVANRPQRFGPPAWSCDTGGLAACADRRSFVRPCCSFCTNLLTYLYTPPHARTHTLALVCQNLSQSDQMSLSLSLSALQCCNTLALKACFSLPHPPAQLFKRNKCWDNLSLTTHIHSSWWFLLATH